MKIAIRSGVFETNSSSVHTLCICTEDQWWNFRNGKMLHYKYDGKLIPLNEKEEFLQDEKYWADENDLQTYEDWKDDYFFGEKYIEEFTTPSGDSMVAFGDYGHG